MENSRASLLDRIGDQQLRHAAKRVLEITERFQSRRATIDGDTRYSEFGRAEQLRAELGKDFAPAFRIAAAPLRATREALTARRAAMKLPQPDKTDIVGEMQRAEIRSYLRALPDAHRTSVVFESNDPAILGAVLTAPPELSGVPKDRFDFLMAKQMKNLFGAEIEAIEQDEAALAEAEATVEVARNDLRMALDPKASDKRRFDSIMEGTRGVPWLIKHDNGEIVVVKIDAAERATYPVATAEEQATGRYFANRLEYEAANNA